MERAKPIYHGDDLQSAIKRAEEIGGQVIKSKAPENASPPVGWWSDDALAMTRTWESSYSPAEARKILRDQKRREHVIYSGPDFLKLPR